MTRAGRPTPRPSGLDAALGGVRGAMATLDRYRTTPGTNAEGGDPGHHASPDLLVRHTMNYLLAADVAERVTVGGPVLDVGSGVGAFSAWLARRLDRPLHLVDHDPAVLQLARRSFADVATSTDVADAPPAAVVTAMEVLEHIGTLDAVGLRTLLRDAGRLPVDVWRIDGPGFRLGRVQRVAEPVANRLWGGAQALLPGITHRLADLVGRRRRSAVDMFAPAPPDAAFSVAPAEVAAASGTGLLAVVHVPRA